MHNGKKSNSISKYTKLKLHRTILKQEITIISPQYIITLGNTSKNALLGIF
jgi:uracil-DNA glycosylase